MKEEILEGNRIRIKRGIFMYFSEALENVSISTPIMILLIILESLFIINNLFCIMNAWVKEAYYLHIFYQIFMGTLNMNLTNWFTVFAMVYILMLITMGMPIIYYIKTNCNTGGKIILLNKFSFTLLFCFDKTVIYYSFCHLCVWTYGGSPTYENITTTNGVEEETMKTPFNDQQILASTIFLIITILQCLFTIIIIPSLRIFEQNLKPAHNTSQSHEKPIIGMVRFFMKITFGIIFALDPYYGNKWPIAIFAFMTGLVLVILHCTYLPRAVFKVGYLQIILDTITFVVGVCLLWICLLQISLLHIYLILIVGLFFIPLLYFTLQFRNRIIMEQNMPEISNFSEFEHGMNLLIDHLKCLKSSKKAGYIMSLMKIHSTNCPEDNCESKLLYDEGAKQFSEDLFNSTELYSELDKPIIPQLFTIENDLHSRRTIHFIADSLIIKFFTSLLTEFELAYSKNSRIYIFRAYFDFYMKNDIFKALYYLKLGRNMKNNVQNEYFMFHLNKMISQSMERSYLEAKSHIAKYVNTVKLEEYQVAYNHSMVSMMLCTNEVINFWEIFLTQVPQVQLASMYAKNILQHQNDVEEGRFKCIKIYPMNLHFLFKLGIFYIEILNNEREGMHIYKKIKEMTEETTIGMNSIEQLGLEAYSKILMLKVGISNDQPGIILDISYDLEQIIGYERGKLVGKSLKNILPPLISDVHHLFIMQFLDTMRKVVMYKEQILYFKSQIGYIFPLKVNLRMIPTLNKINNQIQILAFCKEPSKIINIFEHKITTKNTPMYFICDVEGKVVGISESCCQSLGISINLIDDPTYYLNINELIPQLKNRMYNSNFFREEGYLFKINRNTLSHFADYDLLPDSQKSDEEDLTDYSKILKKEKDLSATSGLNCWGKSSEYTYFLINEVDPIKVHYFTIIKLANKAEKDTFKRYIRGITFSQRTSIKRGDTEKHLINFKPAFGTIAVDSMDDIFSVDDDMMSISSSIINASLSSGKNMMVERKDNEILNKSLRKHKQFGIYLLLSLFLIWFSLVAGAIIFTNLVNKHLFAYKIIKNTANTFAKMSTYHTNMLNMGSLHVYGLMYKMDKDYIQALVRTTLKRSENTGREISNNFNYIYENRGELPGSIEDKWNEIINVSETNYGVRDYTQPILPNHTFTLRLALSQYLAKLQLLYQQSKRESQLLLDVCPYSPQCFQYFQLLNYTTVVGFHSLRIPLEAIFQFSIDFYTHYLKDEKLIVLLFIIFEMIFILINCICVLIKATQIIRDKSQVFSVFGSIRNNELRILLQQSSNFDVQNIWLSQNSHNVEKLMHLCNMDFGEDVNKEEKEKKSQNIGNKNTSAPYHSPAIPILNFVETHDNSYHSKNNDGNYKTVNDEKTMQIQCDLGSNYSKKLSKFSPKKNWSENSKFFGKEKKEFKKSYKEKRRKVKEKRRKTIKITKNYETGAETKGKEENCQPDHLDETPDQEYEEENEEEIIKARIKIKELQKIDKNLLQKAYLPIILCGISFLIISGIDIYYSQEFSANFQLITENLKLVIKRQTSLDFAYLCVKYACLEFIEDPILHPNDDYYFQYYYDSQISLEKELIEFDKNIPKFLNEFSRAIDKFNSEKFCDEVDKIMPPDPEDMCRNLKGDLHKKGLRNLIFNYLTELHKHKMDTHAAFEAENALMAYDLEAYAPFSIKTSKRFLIYAYYIAPYKLFIIGPVLEYLAEIYFTNSKDYIEFRKNIKLYIFLGFTLLLLISYFLAFKDVNEKLRKEIIVSQKIQNIIPISLLSKNETLRLHLKQF